MLMCILLKNLNFHIIVVFYLSLVKPINMSNRHVNFGDNKKNGYKCDYCYSEVKTVHHPFMKKSASYCGTCTYIANDNYPGRCFFCTSKYLKNFNDNIICSNCNNTKIYQCSLDKGGNGCNGNNCHGHHHVIFY